MSSFQSGLVVGQPDIGGGAGGDDHRLVRQVVELLHAAVVAHQQLHGDTQVGIGEVHHLGAFRRDGHVGENQVDLVALQEGNPAGRLHCDELDIVLVAKQILCEASPQIGVEADVASAAIDIAERRFVGEHADDQLVAGLGLV